MSQYIFGSVELNLANPVTNLSFWIDFSFHLRSEKIFFLLQKKTPCPCARDLFYKLSQWIKCSEIAFVGERRLTTNDCVRIRRLSTRFSENFMVSLSTEIGKLFQHKLTDSQTKLGWNLHKKMFLKGSPENSKNCEISKIILENKCSLFFI